MTLRRAVVRPGSAGPWSLSRPPAEDAYDRLIYPSLEREVRVRPHRRAPARGPSANFALNLKPLLMQPPVKGHVTMGLDPGYPHGLQGGGGGRHRQGAGHRRGLSHLR